MGLPAPLARVLDAVQIGAGQMSAGSGVKQVPAVKWLSVPQLVRTALDVLQASSFAKYADKRETMATNPREFYRLPTDGVDPVFVDYVADTGDGFNATFATARCLTGAADGSLPPDPDFAARGTQADLLVFGGDEVYPVASALQYEERLNGVLRHAAVLDDVVGLPPVMALPGNHDWYDGLASFRRNFCESWVQRDTASGADLLPVPPTDQRDNVGGWGAFQSRSYFAVQLNPQWWLWAVDSQLDAPIDAEQLAYFRAARNHLDGAKVILCTATPSWLKAAQAGDAGPYLAESDSPLYTLLWFIDRVLGHAERHRVRLVLTGDQHYYARYTCAEPTPPPASVPTATEPFCPELVTCGGGGAFLASTHHLPEKLSMALRPWPSGSGATVGFARGPCYPDMATSRSIGRARFLSAAWRNGPSLPLLLGGVDTVLFLTFLLHWPLGWTRAWQFWVATGIVAVLLGFYAASGADAVQPRRQRQWATGLLTAGHTLAHLVAGWAVAALVAALVADPARPPWYGSALAILLLAVLGTLVFVTYLHIADRFNCHTLEAFSGLRVEGWKSQLRLRVSADEVVVQVIGFDETPSARGRSELRWVLPRPHVVETFRVPWSGGAPAAVEDQAVATAVAPT